jgi:predicted RNA-binding protein YlxR (DUF448 family)
MKRANPIRRCVGCGKRERQERLFRFAQGRGAYLHPRRSCLDAFMNARSSFVRSLKTTVSREVREGYASLIENSLTL